MAAGIVAVLTAEGCGKQSILSTHSSQARDITVLWWWMLAAATIVLAGALGMLLVAWLRRGTPGLPFVGERRGVPEGMVLLFGIGVPVVALVALFAVADVYLVRQTSPPAVRSTAMTIDVIGHQWWWEVRYPGTQRGDRQRDPHPRRHPRQRRGHVGRRHPQLLGSGPESQDRHGPRPPEPDPARRLASPGSIAGQCSQFCGFQHTHMSTYVVAQTPAPFRAWLSNMAAPARLPRTPQARAGERIFLTSQCASCHRIAGTTANADVGPDLSHLATRSTLAALTIPNTPSKLAAWIRNPQAIKPGDRMPDLGLSPSEIASLVAYLDSLR